MVKKILYILTILAFCGCEVIHDQFIQLENNNGTRRHVLLEFTGFRCVNCPKASEMAQSLKEEYDEQLILVSLHPASNPFTQGTYDYTCPAADTIYRWLGGNATTPFPTGNLNIWPFEGHNFSDYSEWPTMVYNAMKDTVAPNIECLSAIADTIQKKITIHIVHTARLGYNYACWLVEDSVLGVQAMPDGSVNTQYYHRHVLRAAWDDKPFGKYIVSHHFDEELLEMDIPEGCDLRHCYVIALLLFETDHHILNAYEKKVLISDSSSD